MTLDGFGREADEERSPSSEDAPGADEPERAPETAPEAGSASTSETGEDPEPSEATEPDDRDLARARELVREGRVEEAIQRYQRIIERNPKHLKARHNLGVLYDETGAHDRAVDQLEAALAVEPENIGVLTNLGTALASEGHFEEAERILRRAQRIAPEDTEVRAALGILFYRRGLYVQAEAELRWVCEREREHGPAHYYRGEALNRLGRIDEALDSLERASRLQPGNSKAFYTMGILFDRKHLPDQAALMYRKARELARR